MVVADGWGGVALGAKRASNYEFICVHDICLYGI